MTVRETKTSFGPAEGHHPSGDVDPESAEVVSAQLHLPGVKAGPHR